MLDSYKLPAAVTEGEWIDLDRGDGAKFLVLLPTESNRKFQFAMMKVVQPTMVNDQPPAMNGIDLADMVDAEQKAFVETCFSDWRGMPKGTGQYTPDKLRKFAADYPLAIDELFTKATARAREIDEETKALAGN